MSNNLTISALDIAACVTDNLISFHWGFTGIVVIVTSGLDIVASNNLTISGLDIVVAKDTT